MEKRKNDWYERNKDTEEYKKRTKENNKRYRERHREEINRKQRERCKKYREGNKDYLEYQKTYYKENKDKWVEYRNKDSFNCVYYLIDKNNKILRIGSTNNLKNRMVQYFNGNVVKHWGVYKWFHDMELDKVLFIQLDTREKSYCLESLMIERHNPILNQNEIKTDYWDKYIESLGDISNIEDLFEEFDISRYKKIYEDL
ncbi:GIY-YIG nuclease family protein [Clostridium sp.]|uniref:GIY-YIG nuclease family protein n=1 Tax=Clostridium sp. TaxID=1506 RepID=UPI003216D0E9